MDLKKILSPSLNRLAPAALLFFLFVPFMTYDNGIRCFRAPCPASDTGTMLSWLFLQHWPNYTFMLFDQRQSLPSPSHIYSLDLPMLLIGFAVCYAIACALVFAFQRFSSRKKGEGQ